jgi:hypothetical protein
VAILAACQDKNHEAKPLPPAAPQSVEVRDDKGALVAELKLTRPCRATIGPQEMIVGGPPLISTVGSTEWKGEDDPSAGTTLVRNGERIARIFPLDSRTQGAVFDLHGVAQVRVTVTGTTATVENGASQPLRKLTLAGTTITSTAVTTKDSPVTITGTSDLVTAALLSAPELLPEVRMLAACERVLVTKESGT